MHKLSALAQGNPARGNNFRSKRNANLVGSFPEGSGRNNIITKEEEMRNYGAKERAFMAGSFLVFAVLGAVSARSLGEAVYFLAAFALLFSAALFDGVRGRIPTMVPAALSALSFGAAFFVCAPLPSERVFGFCFGLAVPLLVRALWLHFRREEGLGMGDVKLLAALGLLCGGRVIAVLLLGSVFLAAESLVLRKRELPFAPALCLAAAGVLLCG